MPIMYQSFTEYTNKQQNSSSHLTLDNDHIDECNSSLLLTLDKVQGIRITMLIHEVNDYNLLIFTPIL